MPECGRLTRIILSDKIEFEKERRQAIEDMRSLASQDCTVLYRPRENLMEGICLVNGCPVEMTRYYPWSTSEKEKSSRSQFTQASTEHAHP